MEVTMNNYLYAIIVILVASTVSYAEQGQKNDNFWSKLKTRVDKITPAKKSTYTTAVGGVRGAKNDESADIYWKGRGHRSEVSAEELKQFNKGLSSRSEGKNEQAIKDFEAFLASYPQSSLRVDSLQAIDAIKGEQAGAAPVLQPAPLPAATPLPEHMPGLSP